MELNQLLAIAADKGKGIKDLGKMCKDCAFYEQPNINGYQNAIDGAIHCLLMGGTFNCHTKKYTDAGRPCVGFQYALQYFESMDKQNENVEAQKEEEKQAQEEPQQAVAGNVCI